MGREARVRKTRVCRECKKRFLNMTPAQITMHSAACMFESRTGIEIIRMGPEEAEEQEPSAPAESLIIVP